MTKKDLNQNAKYAQELKDIIEPDLFLVIPQLTDLMILKIIL